MPRPSVRRADLFSRVGTLLSTSCEQGVPVEETAHLVGHTNASTTETVYRKELRPVISTGAEIMDDIFGVG
jgi:hypothetical protein